MNSLPKTRPITGQRSDCDLNPGLSAHESSTLTTLLPSHPDWRLIFSNSYDLELIVAGVVPHARDCLSVWTQMKQKKEIAESVAYSLVQFYAVVLFECNEAEDYGPAMTLMNTAFTFYHDG